LSERAFWDVLALLNWKKTGDDDAVMAPAVKALAAKSEAEIKGFADLLAEKLHALDTREHCRHAYEGELDVDDGDDYVSADDFLYLRCCVVANGEKFYRAALEDPREMPQEMEFEAILSLPANAWEKKTKSEFDYYAPTDFESFANKKGWKPTKKTRAGKATGANVPPGNRRPT